MFLVPPQITLKTTAESKSVGQSTKVICFAAGDPMPTIHWYKMQDSGRVILNTNSKLSFTSLQKVDGGTYVCEAKNDAAVVQASYELVVKGLLIIPSQNCSFVLCGVLYLNK